MKPYNLDGKRFRSLVNSDNGEVGGETIFVYAQSGDIVTATYQGGAIEHGQLLARVRSDGRLDMRYHHLNRADEFMLGRCISTPEVLADGRLRFHEEWQWLSGDKSSGTSVIEEI
ncbi:MAG: n-acetylglutamate synthase [Spirochaetaceae bacterium]|nr:MAG: n-acetylglutamate synthase [Spirochaetaceae bacterium]